MNDEKSITFDKICDLQKPSIIKCGPQGTFSFNLWLAEHFFMLMRPLSGFKFETPVLETWMRQGPQFLDFGTEAYNRFSYFITSFRAFLEFLFHLQIH